MLGLSLEKSQLLVLGDVAEDVLGVHHDLFQLCNRNRHEVRICNDCRNYFTLLLVVLPGYRNHLATGG